MATESIDETSCAAGTNSTSGGTGVSVPWQRLRQWIDHHEREERRTGLPVALLPIQLLAISQLVKFIDDAPEIDSGNYISKLMEKIQSQKSKPPDAFMEELGNVPVDGKMQARFRCTLELETHGRFPRPGFGIGESGVAPAFQSKKIAKQFAAKQAFEYLERGSGSLPRRTESPSPSSTNNEAVSPSPQSPPYSPTLAPAAQESTVQQPQQREPQPQSYPPEKRLKPTPKSKVTNQPSNMEHDTHNHHSLYYNNIDNHGQQQQRPSAIHLSSSPSHSSSSSSITPSNKIPQSKTPTIFKQISDLSSSLSIGTPTYEVQPVPGYANNGFFSARPIFRDGSSVPPGTGVVENVAGEQAAKEECAKSLLQYLHTEKENRDIIFKKLMEGIPQKSEVSEGFLGGVTVVKDGMA